MGEPRRVQRQRTKGWRMPANTVYVGRPSIYGNPFRLHEVYCGPTIRAQHTPAAVVEAFRTWLAHDTLHPLMWDRELIVAHVHLKAALLRRELAGKNLACWCPLDQPCHADVLLQIANRQAGEPS